MNVQHKDATITNTDDAFPGAFEVILSTNAKDRDGDELQPDGWKQPLPEHITFDADHGMSVATTVGSGVPSIDGQGRLVVRGTYSSLARAQEVRTLVNEGHIRTTSVAFMTEKSDVKDSAGKVIRTDTTRELLNGAFVAIPSNREALVLSSKSAPTPAEVFGKAGARNSSADQGHLQAAHDELVAAGAMCGPSDDTGAAEGATGGKAAASVRVDVVPSFDTFADAVKMLAHTRRQFGEEAKSIVGSLEAKQDRISDALQDANPDKYAWLRGTLPDSVIFDLADIDGPEVETYQQGYTDDGSVVTLVGDPKPVDIAQVVVPEPDAASEPAEKSADLEDATQRLRAHLARIAAAAS